ncbi:tol-pal system-associated acyl-CoA thioesterase [Oceanospirillum sediminis]|uniref:Tol-pal system-associated acyl-CoA thioesterase n=1 Tax=Oceanospirillum sediminis TaxID=2760088 RepID=A0A839IVX9_9GAMM|nr:tol-pal system-associated acyl-CoA thioesterase [Oceanospirillum sediminis]MBB1488537.1 tol-pal system-associated acyl-CoA thioesterase [Oceanospirillum sediminis]
MCKEFSFNWPVRVYYEDTDAGGVVYYANYLKFYERARTEALRAAGFSQETLRNEENTIFVVSNINVSYRRPARLDDKLIVSLNIIKMARSYLIFQQQITCDDLLLSTAEVKVACVNADTMKPCQIPAQMQEKLTSLTV